ncbi:FUSC family protein [Aureimonas psammosilenae]|uniref:FUSC family protein n=1 Tax=Aureimonas psammosilenae TaxID=2495496 RepID=UPI0012611D1C|nr:FUSC family protein [Aureimonas psammosilenae]
MSFPRPTAREWLFSAKTFVAAMLALYIALACGLPRPYWAMAAVYVVANPLSGATRSKALYRALGTALGACGAVLLVPLLVNAPVLLSLAVSIWTGTFLFVSLLDRTPRSYVFMLAGYSLPLIALPTVGDPGTVFDIAVARTLEITLGIVCASVVHTIVLPAPAGPVFGQSVARWKGEAAGWLAEILSDAEAGGSRLRLAAELRGLDLLISHLAYDVAARGTVRRARDLQSRLAMLLPIISSLRDRTFALKAAEAEPEGYRELGRALAAWMGKGASDEAGAETLRQRIASAEPAGEEAQRWSGLVMSSALSRMRDLLDLWQDIAVLEERVSLGRHASRSTVAFRFRTVFDRARHYDYGILAFSAASVALASFLASLVWIFTGWTEGAGLVIMTAVGASFFAAVDDPATQIKSFTIWLVVATLASALYLFAILPAVHSFEMLVVAFLPFLYVGTLVARPQYTLVALLMAVNVASLVGIQETYSADFSTFANSNLASIAGGFFGLAFTLLTRPFGAALAARRLVRSSWRDLAAIASGASGRADRRFAGRMLDRAGQLAPRLPLLPGDQAALSDPLAELRLGLNLVELKRVRGGLSEELRAEIDALMAAVGRLFSKAAAENRALAPDADLLSRVDLCLERAAAEPGEAGVQAARHALVGMRRALFSGQEPPKELADEPARSFAVAAE